MCACMRACMCVCVCVSVDKSGSATPLTPWDGFFSGRVVSEDFRRSRSCGAGSLGS